MPGTVRLGTYSDKSSASCMSDIQCQAFIGGGEGINQRLMVNLVLLPGEIINIWSGILSTSCGTSFICTGNYYTTESLM
jgi:hypothetical protein